MASSAKKRTRGSKASAKRKRKHSGSEDEEPAFLSSKYAEPPTSKIYNSRFHHKDPAELFRKDLISAMKLPDSEILTADDYWLIADPWKSEWEKGVQVPVNPDALPEPTARILRKKSKECAFRLPKKLIRFTRNNFFNPEIHVMSYTNTLAERTCRYDMDDVDLQWLTLVNEDREDFGLQPLEENVFEQIIEEFEVQCNVPSSHMKKENNTSALNSEKQHNSTSENDTLFERVMAYTNFQEVIKSEDGLGVEYDEDAICDVCRSPDSVEGNEMVFCDSCNICVHQICYGITKIPEGSWLCRTCALGIRPACVLCPNRGGAMKTTRCGQNWAHVGCAVWIPEVSFLNFVKMEPITKISHIPASRWALVCSICKEKVGACIQCSEKNCKVAFHVTCAFQEGLQMRAKLTNADDDKLYAFCQKHSKKLRGCFSDSSEDENHFSVNKKETLTSEERANIRQQKIQAKEAEFYNYVSIDDVAEMFEIDKTDIEIIFNYWKLKRKANWNRALLPPKIDNENNAAEENSPFSFLKKMVHQRQDLERVRNLCYMAMKREKFSIQWILQKQHIFEKQVEIISNKSSELSEEEMTAVLNANFGDMAYDKKHTGLNGPSPNVVSVLTVLSGEEYVKTHLNGAMKSARKSDRIKSERTPNPYAKHYLNGLAVRSQRYLNKPKKVSNLQPSLDVKTNLSFSSQNSTDHLTSDDGCDSSKDLHDINLNSKFISQTDSKFECFSANDNAIVNLESYQINDDSVKQEDCNSEEFKSGTEICFSDIPTFSQSSNDSTFDPSVNISTLSLDELVSDLDLKNGTIPNNCVSNTFQSNNCNSLESETQNFSNIEKELSSFKQAPHSKTFISPKECVDDKLNSIFTSDDISNLSSSGQIIASTNDFEEIKFNLELPVENCVETVSVDTITPLEITNKPNEKILYGVKSKVEKIIDFHNDDKLNSPVHCVIIKSEIPITHSKIESTSKKAKNVKITELCDKPVKNENSESSEFLENNKTVSDKSPTNPVKQKDIKIRPSSNKSSPLRTQSPTYKSTENGIIKGNKSNSKQNFKKLQALAKSKSKNSHSTSSFVNKSYSSSVNKCQEKNASVVCKTDESDQSEVKESSSASAATAVSRKDMLRGYKIPKKPRSEKPEENSLDLKRGNTPLSPLPDITSTSLSGYQTKGPSWRKLEPRTKEVSSCKPRTNININGSIQPQPSERLVLKLKKDTSDPESQRWKADHNNFIRNMNNNWIGSLHPPPPPPPRLLHPHPPPPPRFLTHHPPRPWHRMRSRGGFRQIHMGYGNGPYT